MADHEIPSGNQGVIEPPHQRVLRGLVEIDHHVPAENHVELQAEPDGVHQIEGLKDDVVPNDGRHHELLAAGHRTEVLLPPDGGQGVRQVVNAPLGGSQGLLGDVGGQDPGVPLAGLSPQKFLDVDGDVVGLLAAGAPRAPDGQHLVLLVALDKVRQDDVLKEVEVLLLPHEEGVVGGQPVQHQLQVRRVLLAQQLGDEGTEVRVPLLGEQGGQTAGDQLPLLAQVDAVLGVDEFDKLVKIFVANIGQRHDLSSFSAGLWQVIRGEGDRSPGSAASSPPAGNTCRRSASVGSGWAWAGWSWAGRPPSCPRRPPGCRCSRCPRSPP